MRGEERVRIKALQIHGFKSFVDKIRFEFRPGITGIVGPNGCGKSNVVDAMRWAMGEQSARRLRGKGMEDVIFAGSDARAAVGMAEVVLTFDNADGQAPATYAAFGEIQIARRLYRSGESEYLINKTPCRLRDVQDFFRDTGIGTRGYTIVEQGQIAGIVSAKPEDRRYLIEEAAGIGKYKARRQEAERKIEATEQNLVRVNDVLGEIKRQMGSLERQARKAARHKRLKETQRLLELSLAADERRELAARCHAEAQRLAQRRDEITALDARTAERELALEQRRIELAEHERALDAVGEVLVGLRGAIKELESRIGYERREREALAEINAARHEDVLRLEGKLAEARADADRARAELAELEGSLEAETEAITAAQAQVRAREEAFRAIEAERDVTNVALVEVLTRIARSEDRLVALADRRAVIDRRLRTAEVDLEQASHEESRAQDEERALADGLRTLLTERDRLMDALRGAIERSEAAARETRESAARLQAARERCESRRARLASLREVVERREDLGTATRHLLEQGDATREALGLLAVARDVLDADREVEGAVEAVLAERAEALVVRDLGGALSAVEALRATNAGRGVFLAQRDADLRGYGFVPLGQRLLERVRPQAGFEGVAHALLANVYLVDDLREALALYGAAHLPVTFVTPSGDLLSPDGVLHGGAAGAGSGLLSRVREVRELETEVAALELDAKRAADVSEVGELAAQRAADELENLRNRHHSAALALASHEKDLEGACDRVKRLGVAQETRAQERAGLLNEREALAAETAHFETSLAEARALRGERQSAVDAASLRLGAAARELAGEQAALSARRAEHAGRVEKRDRLYETLCRAEGTLHETQEWIARRTAEIAAAEVKRDELAAGIAEAEEALAARLRDEEAARLSSEVKREVYERGAEAVREIEAVTRELRATVAARRGEAGATELALRETELRLQHLEQSVAERWNVELASWTAPTFEESAAPAAGREHAAEGEGGSHRDAGAVALVVEAVAEPGDEEPALTPRAAAELAGLGAPERRARLDEVRRRLEALGEVNLAAIEEHEELAERQRFLAEQQADLESTLGSLREAIQRINRTSRRRFQETFDAVNARFVENFPRLFRGGKATLQLTEEADVLEAGIEILASPPGKRVQNVNMLSGGEKTLTAVALLVSVFQVRPSPFFLLDEVDAALDDANVGRFNEIVKELARDSQFLVVTHNKRTIEISDVLYGVTMEEKGVSKLVAVELRQG